MLFNALSLTVFTVFLVEAAATNTNLVGDWDECPVNITSYTGCNVMVHAYFSSPNINVSCSEDFSFAIALNNDVLKPPSTVSFSVVNITSSTGGDRCRVVGHIIDVPVGYHDVEFRAQYIGTVYGAITLTCDDHLLVEEAVPSPTVYEPLITCNGVLLKWVELLLADNSNHDTIQYSVVVMATSLSYTVSNTTVMIPFTDGLQYDTQYTMTLSGLYCGNHGNSVNVSLYTAMAPMVTIDQRPPHQFNINSTHGHVTHTLEIVHTDCLVSHPKTVTTITNCSSSLTSQGRSSDNNQFTSVTAQHPIVVSHDGNIGIDTVVPLDHQCTIDMILYNGDLSTSTDTLNINTNQLRSCSFIVNTDSIVSTCTYSEFSSLWGCKVELISGYKPTIFIDIPSSKSHGFFNDLCNDEYILMKCYGLRYDPNDGHHGNVSILPPIVIYDGSPNHTATVTVRTGTDCTRPSTVTTGTSLSPIGTPTQTPSQEAISNNKSTSTLVIVSVVVVVCALLVLIIAITVTICALRNKCLKSKVTPSPEPKSIELIEQGTFTNIYAETEGVNPQPTYTAPSINSGQGADAQEHKGASVIVKEESAEFNIEMDTSPKPKSSIKDLRLHNASLNTIQQRIGSDLSMSSLSTKLKNMVIQNAPSISPTVRMQDSETELMIEDSVPPSFEEIGDTVHDPPPDSTTSNSQGASAFVVSSQSRSHSGYSVSSPHHSPRNKEPDQRNLLMSEQDKDEEEFIDADKLHPSASVAPPLPASNHGNHMYH